MNRVIGSVVCAATVGMLLASQAQAQRTSRGGAGAGPVAPALSAPVQTIPLAEANTMLLRQRVFLFTPPVGSQAYGIDRLGPGYRVWALLPSCRAPNPD